MKKLMLLLPFLFAVSCGDAYAEGIPFKPQTDLFQVGKDGSTDNKEIIFNTGDGASNPALTVDGVAKTFDLNKALGITGDVDATGAGSVGGNFVIGGNNLDVGDGTETDQFINFNISGGESVGFKYDAASGEVLQKQKAGNNYKKLGSGAGGGGGSNFNNAFTDDQNANAEDGTDSWTASAGTFAVDTDDPIEGEQSFEWTPAAQNDTLTGPVLDFDRDVFKGRACQAQIDAIGGDENLTLQVIDGNNDVVAEKAYSAQTIAAPFSVYFRCPSQAKITADAQKGNLRLRLINSGASASPLIKWDKSYAGTLIGLSETVLPDILRVNVENNGTTASGKTGQSAPDQWWDSITRTAVGKVVVDYTGLGLANSPGYSITAHNARIGAIDLQEVSNTSMTIVVLSTGGSAVDEDFSLALFKNGSDAKQSVQVYNSIPKVSENVNRLEGFYDSTELTLTDAVKDQTPNQWIINTAKSLASDARKDFTVKDGIFSVTPNCEATGESASSQNVRYEKSTSSSTNISFLSFNSSDTNDDGDFSFSCTKAPDDYKLPTVQPIVLRENAIFFEGETDSLIGGYASFGGASDESVCSTSPCTRYREFGDIGRSMALTRSATGVYNFSAEGFKPDTLIDCSCDGSSSNPQSDSGENCFFAVHGLISDGNGDISTDLKALRWGSSSNFLTDMYMIISCRGPKPL